MTSTIELEPKWLVFCRRIEELERLHHLLEGGPYREVVPRSTPSTIKGLLDPRLQIMYNVVSPGPGAKDRRRVVGREEGKASHILAAVELGTAPVANTSGDFVAFLISDGEGVPCQCPESIISKSNNYLWLYNGELLFESLKALDDILLWIQPAYERLAHLPRHLRGVEEAQHFVARWLLGDDIGEEDGASRDAALGEDFSKFISGVADEGDVPSTLFVPPGLTDDGYVGVARAGGSVEGVRHFHS